MNRRFDHQNEGGVEDDYQKRIRLELEALEQQTLGARKYPEVLSRIADALEHQSLFQVFQLLMAMGKQPDGIMLKGHLASCESCRMLKEARSIGAIEGLPRGIIKPN